MRLLNTKTFIFKEFVGRFQFGNRWPAFATISHRWGEDEISYQEYLDNQERFSKGECRGYGWEKISQACYIARQRYLEWVWIDTCCIDKKSSAELSESINSMFEWYQMSIECYVFLPDVHKVDLPFEDGHESEIYYNRVKPNIIGPEHDVAINLSQFRESVWFTRSWTLQELLAPESVLFYDTSFNCIGSKWSLLTFVEEITSIPGEYLVKAVKPSMGQEPYHSDRILHIFNASVAERMEWASLREATREEGTYSERRKARD